MRSVSVAPPRKARPMSDHDDVAMLLAQRRFDQLADRLVTSTAEDAEAIVLEVLASGRLQGLRRSLSTRGAEPGRSLVVDLFVADAGVRVQGMGALEIQRLFDRVTG